MDTPPPLEQADPPAAKLAENVRAARGIIRAKKQLLSLKDRAGKARRARANVAAVRIQTLFRRFRCRDVLKRKRAERQQAEPVPPMVTRDVRTPTPTYRKGTFAQPPRLHSMHKTDTRCGGEASPGSGQGSTVGSHASPCAAVPRRKSLEASPTGSAASGAARRRRSLYRRPQNEVERDRRLERLLLRMTVRAVVKIQRKWREVLAAIRLGRHQRRMQLLARLNEKAILIQQWWRDTNRRMQLDHAQLFRPVASLYGSFMASSAGSANAHHKPKIDPIEVRVAVVADMIDERQRVAVRNLCNEGIRTTWSHSIKPRALHPNWSLGALQEARGTGHTGQRLKRKNTVKLPPLDGATDFSGDRKSSVFSWGSSERHRHSVFSTYSGERRKSSVFSWRSTPQQETLLLTPDAAPLPIAGNSSSSTTPQKRSQSLPPPSNASASITSPPAEPIAPRSFTRKGEGIGGGRAAAQRRTTQPYKSQSRLGPVSPVRSQASPTAPKHTPAVGRAQRKSPRTSPRKKRPPPPWNPTPWVDLPPWASPEK